MPTQPVSASIVFEGVELTDRAIDVLFKVLPDAVPASINGVVTVSATIEALDGETAALAVVDAVTRAWPQATAIRVDQDLVAVSDIAERAERSRESVRLLIEGKRGPGGFPTPVGVVGNAIRVWPWALVVDWFGTALGDVIDTRGVMPAEAAVIDAHLARRKSTGPVRATAVG